MEWVTAMFAVRLTHCIDAWFSSPCWGGCDDHRQGNDSFRHVVQCHGNRQGILSKDFTRAWIWISKPFELTWVVLSFRIIPSLVLLPLINLSRSLMAGDSDDTCKIGFLVTSPVKASCHFIYFWLKLSLLCHCWHSLISPPNGLSLKQVDKPNPSTTTHSPVPNHTRITKQKQRKNHQTCHQTNQSTTITSTTIIYFVCPVKLSKMSHLSNCNYY